MIISKQKLREQARKQVGRLLNENNHRCFYCNLPLVRGNRIHPVIYQNLNVILYIDNGICCSLLATCEHLLRLKDGGNNKNNLTVACRPCNQLKAIYPDGIRLKYKLKIREGFKTNMREQEFYDFCSIYKTLIPTYKWKEDCAYEYKNYLYLVKKFEIYKVGKYEN